MSTVSYLTEKGVAKPPRWLPSNVHYETTMGSAAYGVSTESSDVDVYGFAIPFKDDVFPHLRGEIPGFGAQKANFQQYQEHHLRDPDGRGRTFDLTIFGIVRYFQLAMENNPNVLDSLFTAADCVLHATQSGNMVRENRRLFLHKGCWPKLKGYAYSQLHKIESKALPEGKRRGLVEKYGYDVKFAYHVVRLLLQAEQALTLGDIDLRRDREVLKAIRRGEWTEAELRSWASAKERELERIYEASTLPWGVRDREPAIRRLLLDCLEAHFGTLSDAVVDPDAAVAALRRISDEIEKVRNIL